MNETKYGACLVCASLIEINEEGKTICHNCTNGGEVLELTTLVDLANAYAHLRDEYREIYDQ